MSFININLTLFRMVSYIFSLLAIPRANISIFHGEFQHFYLKIKNTTFWGNMSGYILVPFERTSNFGLEMPFCKSR